MSPADDSEKCGQRTQHQADEQRCTPVSCPSVPNSPPADRLCCDPHANERCGSTTHLKPSPDKSAYRIKTYPAKAMVSPVRGTDLLVRLMTYA
jgi:hypothetical protein